MVEFCESVVGGVCSGRFLTLSEKNSPFQFHIGSELYDTKEAKNYCSQGI